MIVLLFALLAFSAVLAAPSWYYARRGHRWFVSDYVTVFAPVVLWFLLTLLGIGPQSLANIVEVLAVAAFNPMTLTMRVFVLDRLWPRPGFWSCLCLLTGLALPLMLRLTIPILPE
jgi:hypothetical protein